MASATGAPTLSTVNFPVSDPQAKFVKPAPHLRPPYLPFRRISLPTSPSLMHRESFMSVASFGSLPEEEEPPRISQRAAPAMQTARKEYGRPKSVESPRRKLRRRDVSIKPADESRDAKRRKIVEEFYETERAYADGLEMIYSHFLTPIISSLDTPQPLLDRPALTAIFSNFIDIWNLHRSLFFSLSSLLSKFGFFPSTSVPNPSIHVETPSIAPILLEHFPYLSLYNPFVTSFPSTITTLTELTSPPTSLRPNPQYDPTFALFLRAQESDPKCGKLKLRDWLLTIVQRCPRYLLLLKDLINCTDPDDLEYDQLMSAHALVSRITTSLNTSLHTHAQTLSLLALQRSTPNLPFQLIVPGRNLLKRGGLLQIERSDSPREREFLLFSDCLVWLASEEVERTSWVIPWGSSSHTSSGSGQDSPSSSFLGLRGRPGITRSRSKSEAELSSIIQKRNSGESLNPDSSGPAQPPPTKQYRKSYHSQTPLPPPMPVKRHSGRSSISSVGEERWLYKGHVALIDLEVIVSPAREEGDERRWEVLSPEGSFALYAATVEERDEWVSAVRHAKSQLMVSLNLTNPNSTLTSSASTNHVRRSLQALPFHPSDERITSIRASPGVGKRHKNGRGRRNSLKPSGEDGGIYRNVGHMKGNDDSNVQKLDPADQAKKILLGQKRGKVDHWVPAIWIPDEKTNECMRCGKMFGWRRRRHHCRLCGRCVCAACSGQTFFITDPTIKDDNATKPARACDSCYETVFPVVGIPTSSSPASSSSQDSAFTARERTNDTITSLSNFPSWLSMPALPTQKPQALMALNTEDEVWNRDKDWNRERERNIRVRLKTPQRPRSYYQILEDFKAQSYGMETEGVGILETPLEVGEDNENRDDTEGRHEGEEVMSPNDELQEADVWFTPTTSAASSPMSSPRKRREDTARRSKRFSVPAIALHATNVTAHTSLGGVKNDVEGRRFSLILAGRNGAMKNATAGQDSAESKDDVDLGKGIAAGKLSELLGRKLKV